MRLRVRTPGGENLALSLADDTPFEALQLQVQAKCGVLPAQQQVLVGYPPKVLDVAGQVSLAQLGLRSGDTLIVRVDESKTEAELRLVVRQIADDNSCLFNAVGYAMEGDRQASPTLRQVVGSVVLSNQSTYNTAILDGKNPKDYATYIQKPETWGGAVELQVLADYYKVEVVAVDAQTTNLYTYGANKDFAKRAYLLYNGVHYDCIVHNPGDDAANDKALFAAEDQQAEAAVRQLVQAANKEGRFVNVRTFTLRCATCQEGLVGSSDATAHARSTGHANFEEYRP